jgi:hypothetical protein
MYRKDRAEQNREECVQTRKRWTKQSSKDHYFTHPILGVSSMRALGVRISYKGRTVDA